MTHIEIPLSDPDISTAEIEAVSAVLKSPRLSQGPMVEQFEQAFAAYLGRKHAVAVASGTLGLLLTLRAYGIGAGHEVVTSAYSWHQIGHAIPLAGAQPVFADIDYWSGTLAPDKAAARIGVNTHALVAANINGHPAAWAPLRELADKHGLLLIEDSSEAIGSRYQDKPVGSFGDCAIFDFSQPGAITCGEGGMVVTDDAGIAAKLRNLRSRRLDERFSVVAGAIPPCQAGMSELAAALGLAQLARLDAILARRQQVEQYYYEYIKSFEGIKDPYVAPEVNEIHWFLYQVHLGTRFTRSSRDAMVDDLQTAGVEAAAYCQPLHRQPAYRGRTPLLVTEKVADRVLALPLHAHLSEDQVAFIVQTAKDASINIGAGVAIYL
jgi:dTDP-4-amino-4,6-dideoxygalactose transaminase